MSVAGNVNVRESVSFLSLSSFLCFRALNFNDK